MQLCTRPIHTIRRLLGAVLVLLPATARLCAQQAPAATEMRRLPLAEARRGGATDAHFIYAISDSEIGKI